jgi:outer membrane receptor protein involved in Fe transport
MNEVVVQTNKITNTETAVVLTMKEMPQVASGISAAQIAKSPDRNAAEVAGRIPGVSIIDDRFIIVRGLAQRYNNAWINGLPVPSTEVNSRAFPFDLLPGSQIDNMLIYKSPSPEIPGDFSGGFVKITSKTIPDKNLIEVGYTTGFNVRTQFQAFKKNPGSGTDFLAFDLNKRPLPTSFPRHLDMTDNPEELTRLTKEGFNNDWQVKTVIPVPDQRLSFMLARRFKTKNSRTVGNITAINYSNTYKTVIGVKSARYGIYDAVNDKPSVYDDYLDNQYVNDVRLGAMHNWAFVLNPANRIEFKNLVNILGRNRLTERTGIKDMSSLYYREQTEILYSSRLTYSGQLSGTHNLRANQTLTWDAGYSFASKAEPDRRIVANYAGIGSEDDIANVVTGNDNISRYFQSLRDHSAAVAVNYKYTFEKKRINPTLKAGIYNEFQHRNYTPREFIYRYDNLSYEVRQEYLKLPFEEMLSEHYLGADAVYIDEITRKSYGYEATVALTAGYVLADIPIGKFNIYAGLRVENYWMRLSRDRADAPSIILIKDDTENNLDWLPSINMIYKITKKHQLRAAYGRSLNRPELRELSPAVYFDFDLFNEIGGNENLKTAYINNVDLKYEFYPAMGEIVSLGLFYKHFKDPIEWTFIDMGGSLRYQYENANKAESFGIETEVRKKLDFMRMPNFTIVLNAAFIKSRVHFLPGEVVSTPDRPMQGQSPYIINIGLYYQSVKWGLNIALLYNRIGKRIVGIGKTLGSSQDVNTMIPDAYEMPRNELDFTISKTLGKGVEIRLSVKDILSENIVFKQFPKFEKNGETYEREQITKKYNPGQSISLGLSWKINK